MSQPYNITSLGDSALIIEWEQQLNQSIHQQVMQVYYQLQTQATGLILDLIPSYASLTVVYNARTDKQAFATVSTLITQALNHPVTATQTNGRLRQVPVCYHPSLGPDLERMAQEKDVSVEEIIRLHTGTTYTVYMLGFLPGFPYMGTVPDLLNTPRLNKPRLNIPAGSVGIAGLQTGIYPLASPGGWNIIGQTPLQLFDASQQNPCYFQPGDQVQFTPVTLADFHALNCTAA